MDIRLREFEPMHQSDIKKRICEGVKKKGNHAILLVEDCTRGNYEVPTIVLEHIVEMYGTYNVTLVVGNGMHRTSTFTELCRKFGRYTQDVRILQNNPMCNRDWLKEYKEEKDAHLFALSTTVPHMSVGMSGGGKVVLPGCGHWTNINHLHKSKRFQANMKISEASTKLVDTYIVHAISALGRCLAIMCSDSHYQVSEFKDRAKDFYKVKIPTDLPQAAILYPVFKIYDFQQLMNAFNVMRTGSGGNNIVQPGGIIGVHCRLRLDIGTHYMFQAINGIYPVKFDNLYKEELRDRYLVLISDIPRHILQDYFEHPVNVVRDVVQFNQFVRAIFPHEEHLRIDKYIGSDIMIGE